MRRTLTLALLALAACGDSSPPPASPGLQIPKIEAPPAVVKVKSDAEKNVVDVAVGSPDHKTLVAAVTAADLVPALSSPGGIYTVFAPTDAAFAALPAGTVDELLKPENKGKLKLILQHHAAVPILNVADMKDGQTLTMSDGKSVTFHVQDGQVTVDGAKILGSVPAVNGVVHVVDAVILPQ